MPKTSVRVSEIDRDRCLGSRNVLDFVGDINSVLSTCERNASVEKKNN